MGSHDVDHSFSPKLIEAVCADDGIVMAKPEVIDAGFEFDEIFDVCSAARRPVHVADDSTARKSSTVVAACQLLEDAQHSILIEMSVRKICF